MRAKMATIMIACLLALLPVSALASDTEADAIQAVLSEWSDQTDRAEDPEMHNEYAHQVFLLWQELPGGSACETYADRGFSILVLVGLSATLEQPIGLASVSYLLDSLEEAEYACRIAV